VLGELERQLPDLTRDLELRLPRTTERIRHARVLAHRRRIAPAQAVGERDCRSGSLHRHQVRRWTEISDEAHELAEHEGMRTSSPCIDNRVADVRLFEPDHEIGRLEGERRQSLRPVSGQGDAAEH